MSTVSNRRAVSIHRYFKTSITRRLERDKRVSSLVVGCLSDAVQADNGRGPLGAHRDLVYSVPTATTHTAGSDNISSKWELPPEGVLHDVLLGHLRSVVRGGLERGLIQYVGEVRPCEAVGVPRELPEVHTGRQRQLHTGHSIRAGHTASEQGTQHQSRAHSIRVGHTAQGQYMAS